MAVSVVPLECHRDMFSPETFSSFFFFISLVLVLESHAFEYGIQSMSIFSINDFNLEKKKNIIFSNKVMNMYVKKMQIGDSSVSLENEEN